tara:strand:+ start:155 stop:415 length:261 start_codon:yes stop_codon:yes gene_type:complete
MNVREYYKKKLGEPLSEIHEDLYTGKELMDLAQECVNEALRQAKNNEALDLVSKRNAKGYAEFCVICDRGKLPLLELGDYIKHYGC